MEKTSIEIKKGVKAHFLKTDLFKTDFTCIFMTTSLKRESITRFALLPFIIRRGSNKFANQYLINKELENLYGASFDLGIDKNGDNIVFKFYIESINNEYALNGEDILKQVVEDLLDIVFNPIKNNGKLNEEFLEVEKQNLKNVIESKIDDKDSYALNSCIENMYGENGFGLYQYGYSKDVDDININNLSESYDWIVDNSKIDIFISGNVEQDKVSKYLLENENIKKLKPRDAIYIINNENSEIKEITTEKVVQEKMNVTQGKLVIGLDVRKNMDNVRAVGAVYNAILGDGANSMMFQNVREKEGLAYSSKSSFIKAKMNIFIRCGIQIENYDKALSLIKIQLENIKNGDFTDEHIENAKTYLISAVKNVNEEQDAQIVYYLGQELNNLDIEPEEYIELINKVSKDNIIEFANSVCINTVYFLRN